jgi:predicted transposase YdaD
VDPRYPDEFARGFFEEVLGMEESATYQAIFRRAREEGREEGRIEGARRMVLLQGEAEFGPPDAGTRAALERIDDLARLEALAVRLLSAGSWQEVLPPQAPPRRSGRRRTGG